MLQLNAHSLFSVLTLAYAPVQFQFQSKHNGPYSAKLQKSSADLDEWNDTGTNLHRIHETVLWVEI